MKNGQVKKEENKTRRSLLLILAHHIIKVHAAR